MRLRGVLRSRRTPCYVRWQFGCATVAYSSRSIHVEQRKHPQGRDINLLCPHVSQKRILLALSARPANLLTNSVRPPFAFRYAAFCSAKCDLSQRKRLLIVRPWQSTHCTSCPDALVRCQPRPVPCLKEAYSVGFVHKNVLYRTCGHNELCPYSGCLKCLQVNKSYAELTFN